VTIRLPRRGLPLCAVFLLAALAASAASAASAISATLDVFHFQTDPPDGQMAAASRPATTGKIAIEAADDFVLASPTSITSATFTGLLTGGAAPADVTEVVVEIYRLFPLDSVNPPSGNVPTRTNSPSDVAFTSRDSAASGLTFSSSVVSVSFNASNSVLNGIHPSPNQTTGGEGPVTGQEVTFTVTFTPPLELPADPYFFVPQVAVSPAAGQFYWLSAARPISASGTPFAPDRESWIRDSSLAPDWLRVGTDIVGATGGNGGNPAPAFNASFSLDGVTSAVPPPPIVGIPALSGLGLLALALGLAAAAFLQLSRARRRVG
jgi:hypothetical protein